MSIFMSEFLGSMLLILLGCGVCANVALKKSNGNGGGWIVITTGWALAVAIPALIFGNYSGAHFNPALTIALAAIGKISWATVPQYFAGEFLGAFVGAVLVFIMYHGQFEATEDPGTKLGVFATGPAVKSTLYNFLTEAIGTFVLVFGILGLGANQMAPGINTIVVGGLIFAIGLSLGGPTGYAINPCRDLSPRIAHAILPIPKKGDSNWGYAWIPVVAPIVGGLVAAFFYQAIV
ncbi:MIP/aquaporin family protein [Clostridium saccharobutylicum]|uniref:Glycerol uptake facilitator protein GlpF n=1 Tax=Clostridium saccharobutylicum DSM 13864 TaxID=1345695 RepID=U5MPW7_CLOSA|nr:MIP/aquaporin family protein [Clostridium saccharobutylicum]AGX42553.1 glycerol uptake facilitator protein GlpF [Clostridium saccharobutylicum DSM 13864]AQR89839.1 glycerol uptake facilitator protein [Clostridium saccharobutylicum]AQR99741.1 glycerol uptake facilitator protein [Clostridium saccharobutylicum]AQS09471.1 glycerol uptake facilitator protein [Clostridium saccharobutylicum]AQS13727.1 glycerol uptake facilitator protein [Clostridium saccharobutylicum]